MIILILCIIALVEAIWQPRFNYAKGLYVWYNTKDGRKFRRVI